MAQTVTTLFDRPFEEFRTRYYDLRRSAARVSGITFLTIGIVWLLLGRYYATVLQQAVSSSRLSVWWIMGCTALLYVSFLWFNRNKNHQFPGIRTGWKCTCIDLLTLLIVVLQFTLILFILNELAVCFLATNLLEGYLFTAGFLLFYGALRLLSGRQPSTKSLLVWLLAFYLCSGPLKLSKPRFPAFADMLLTLSLILFAVTSIRNMCLIGYDYSKNYFWRISASVLEFGAQFITLSLNNIFSNPITRTFGNINTLAECSKAVHERRGPGKREFLLLEVLISRYKLHNPHDYFTEFRMDNWIGIPSVPFLRRIISTAHKVGDQLPIGQEAGLRYICLADIKYPLSESLQETICQIEADGDKPVCIIWDIPHFSRTLVRILVIPERCIKLS